MVIAAALIGVGEEALRAFREMLNKAKRIRNRKVPHPP
jgi:hypothetical protein